MKLTERINQSIRDVADFPKKGIVFKDITPILKDAQLSKDICDELATYFDSEVTHVAGIESRGFLFGFPAAMKKDISFILIRKKGKLPYKTASLKYDLEYGSAEIEMHIDAVKQGDKVIIHDDLLATGGTAVAAAKLIKQQGAEVVGFSFIVELSFLKGRDLLEEFTKNINSIIKF
ncbi:MAG: adenine phosphoribosyltransferase [Flavobacteriales bacterium]|nr:adenine phosphoribosyltransferase [Flavobacteriales bacterium]